MVNSFKNIGISTIRHHMYECNRTCGSYFLWKHEGTLTDSNRSQVSLQIKFSVIMLILIKHNRQYIKLKQYTFGKAKKD